MTTEEVIPTGLLGSYTIHCEQCGTEIDMPLWSGETPITDGEHVILCETCYEAEQAAATRQ